MPYAGELAALSTALAWSFTAIFFGEAGKRIGSFHVNKIRLLFAVLIYAGGLLVGTGSLLPQGINLEQFGWLTLSGLIGLVIGDGCGFKALVMIGPRLMTLVAASSPIMALLIAAVWLGEIPRPLDLLGIAITLGGIVWVVLERSTSNHLVHREHPDRGTLARGIALSFAAAFCQALGLVLSKHAMLNAGGVLPPFEASMTRMIAATIIIWGYSAVRGTATQTIRHMFDLRATMYSLAGAICGPVLGVWMSLVAVSLINTGVASTLNATTPILIIPTVVLVYREKVSARAVLGAVLAVGGIALLFLS